MKLEIFEPEKTLSDKCEEGLCSEIHVAEALKNVLTRFKGCDFEDSLKEVLIEECGKELIDE